METEKEKEKKLLVTILHYDLGIGGAERLVIDIAKCLNNLNYDLQILTTHHDHKHCFEETNITGNIIHKI